MNNLQKKLLKTAVKLYTNLPVDDWYIQTYIDKIEINAYYVKIDLDKYNFCSSRDYISIIVSTTTKIDNLPIIDVTYVRLINGIYESFKCYETAYNFVPINTPHILAH